MEVRKKPINDLTEVQDTPGYDFSIRAIALLPGWRGNGAAVRIAAGGQGLII